MISRSDAQLHLKVWSNPLFGLFWKVVATPVILAGTVATLVINPLFGGLVYYGVATYARRYVEEMQEAVDVMNEDVEDPQLVSERAEFAAEWEPIQRDCDATNLAYESKWITTEEYNKRVEALNVRIDDWNDRHRSWRLSWGL